MASLCILIKYMLIWLTVEQLKQFELVIECHYIYTSLYVYMNASVYMIYLQQFYCNRMLNMFSCLICDILVQFKFGTSISKPQNSSEFWKCLS